MRQESERKDKVCQLEKCTKHVVLSYVYKTIWEYICWEK